jgi:RsiW-degrading membrane proteinase PrsW (M82 family)
VPSPVHVRALAWLLALACLLLVAGCGEHLAGTNDVALDYRIETGRIETGRIETGRETAAKPVDAVVADVQARLAAAQVSADIDVLTRAEGAGLRIVVDRDSAQLVDDLLVWRGGIAVWEPDPGVRVALVESAGITPRTEVHADGTVERYDTGPADVVTAAVQKTTPPAGHRVLVELVDATTVRTHVVKDPPRVDLRSEIERVDARAGNTLLVRLRPAGATKVDEAARALGSSPVLIARDRSVLRAGPLAPPGATGNVLSLPFPDDLYAYARAHRTRMLLDSPVLPALSRTAVATVPTSYPLAVACVAIPMLLSFAWIFFVRGFDRAHPEPLLTILGTFALGGLSVIPAGLAEYTLMSASPYLNPTLMTLGGQLAAFPGALAVFTVVVGFSEEGSKLLGAWTLAYHRREFDEPVDGIIYGAVSALGFAAVENVKYFALGRLSPVVIIVRTFTSIPAHMFFGAIWGYALGRKLVDKRTSVLAFLAAAALVHGAFDTFLSIDGMAGFAILLNVALSTLFIVLLRRALRHGVVTPEAARVPAASRVLFQLGSLRGFALSAIALHVLALSVFMLGVYMELQHLRVGYGFVVAMSTLVTLLGFAAYSLSKTIPLDVVVDAYGVTFAGAARAWRTVLGIERGHEDVRIRSTDGDLTLGPGSPAVMGALLRALESHARAHAGSPTGGDLDEGVAP